MQGRTSLSGLPQARIDTEPTPSRPDDPGTHRLIRCIWFSFASFASLAVSGLSLAAERAQATAPAISMGSLVQMMLGLAVVLAFVGAIAWIMKRFSLTPNAAGGAVKVIGGAAVGTRERVVLVEVAGIWLVLGVAPGQVRALAQMPKSEMAAESAPAACKSFQDWLKQIMEKGHAK